MAERKSYPVLPLRGTVLFPEITVPIGAVRPGTLRAIDAGVKAGSNQISPLVVACRWRTLVRHLGTLRQQVAECSVRQTR